MSSTVRQRNLSVNVIREPAFVDRSARLQRICWEFGIPPREAPTVIAEGLAIDLLPGSITLVRGPSGSGKSTILRAIAEEAGAGLWPDRLRFPHALPIVDAVAPRRPLATSLEILTACGLGEPRLWIRRFQDLSDGERFRARLARAIGQAVAREDEPIFCDEFTSRLHRRIAGAIAYNLRKLVTRHGLTLIVASPHDDIARDLQPDAVIECGQGGAKLTRPPSERRHFSLRERTAIEPGSVRDYARFAPMHYRHRDGLGFVDKVFLLKERRGGEPIGILVFAHAPRELALRNLATEGRFVRNVRRLNKELRILRRLVMHPDVRGCGLGHWFVKRTLPLVGVRFVECLAAMGGVNPVFERAGMDCIGRCPLPRGRLALLERLRAWNVDPFSPDFDEQVARYPRIRKLVEDSVQAWVNRMHGASVYVVRDRPAGFLVQAFRQVIGEPPRYYLWDRGQTYPRAAARTDSTDPTQTSSAIGMSHRSACKNEQRRNDEKRRHSPDAPSSPNDGRAARPRRRPTQTRHEP